MSVYKSNRKKNYPCLRCNEHVKLNENAVKCALCDLWVHQSCEYMSNETFKVLDTQNEEMGQCFWSCRSCQSYALKFDKRMCNVEKRMQELESTRIPNIENDLGVVKKDITYLKETAEKLSTASKENEGANHSSVTATVLEEMKERESRRLNLIIHNLAEPEADITESQECILKDKESLQELLNVVEAEVIVDNASRFVKRLGRREEEDILPRPLLVGFKSIEHCSAILDKSPNLSQLDEPWSSINIVRDLTKTQRKEEKKLREDAVRKNSQLTEEEKGNWDVEENEK